ncbi:type II/IV secretion system ATPase subunit, partial [Candidatus Woesearchaeota archaeon]|nr:type II/IV secretion system ATPase subunit [Candidatus Woesearchaeota archaeon]
KQIAGLYNHVVKTKKFLLSLEGSLYLNEKRGTMHSLISMLRGDPVGTYVEILRILREEKIINKKLLDEPDIQSSNYYISILSEFRLLLEKSRIIQSAEPFLEGYKVGDRTVYKKFFSADITPDFIFTRLMSKVPTDGRELDRYIIEDGTDVTIFEKTDDIKHLYFLSPPEFKISEDKYELLDMAKKVLIEHKPKAEEFVDPDKMRSTFFNIGKDMLLELAERQGLELSFRELQELTSILVRNTVGFGLLEVLLHDDKVQDITINGPIGQTPVFIVHQDYDECVTNIIPSSEDAESWATKFRLISGRPLDEANPVLDTELIVPGARARVAIVSRPLNPWGLAYALRRHRDQPWTLSLFVKNRMINPLAAGLMSFLIDGARTMLIAGTRSSGKTSFLAATLVEVMRKYRIITMEDTLELPVDALRELGYNIQPMKVRSAITGGENEMEASEGIRTSLRMGDSALIVGEIRSMEARALYEAMRIGALANVVAGTIHGDSPYGVYDRVVNDLGVPKTSFKATDIIVVCNPVRSSDGLSKWRRVMQITEVRKKWEDDPLRENGFVDLMKYDTREDTLKPTEELLNGDSDVLKSIASNVGEWVGNWDAVWDNILLRAKMKELLINYSEKTKNKDILEARFVIASNDQFHRISNKVKKDVGSLEPRRILFEWEEWLKKMIKMKKV